MPTKAKFLASSFVLFEKDNKILLLLRENTGYMDNLYGFPAGHIDEGETPLEAACREAKEEVALSVKPENLEMLGVVQTVGNGSDSSDYLNFFFRAKKWQGEPKNMEPEKCGHLEWFSLDDLPDNLLEHVALILQNIKKSPTLLPTEQVRNRNPKS